jgi:hypothetical protein
MNDVERGVRELQVVDISDRHAEIGNTSLSSQPQCRRNCGWGGVNAYDRANDWANEPFGEIDGDRAGPNGHVK